MDSSVRNGPLSRASPVGKAKKWKTEWGHIQGAYHLVGQHTHCARAHVVNHLSKKKRQMSDTDRRCPEPGGE